MDPISLFFASYLEAISSKAYEQMIDENGVEPQTLVVTHQGINISYQHQFWQVDKTSVCIDLEEELKQFSACTLAAKTMFAEMCQELQISPKQDDWRYDSLKEMYCYAASEFQPTVATIDWFQGDESELSAARRACSTATLDAQGSRNPEAHKKRDTICRKYHQIKEREEGE